MAAGEKKTRRMRTPGKRAIRAQLDRITASTDFDTTQRSADFLRFVVTEALAGRADEITQHAIAASVFGRGDEFDPGTDPIVRMQAGRVRRSLKHYYLTAGAADPVLIEMPKGSYVPTFTFRESSPKAPGSNAAPAVTDGDSWPTILVSPLRNLTGREDVDFIAQGLASDLATELSRDKALHVFLSPGEDAGTKRTGRARFELTGTIALRGDELKINLHLLDRPTGRQTWARTCLCAMGPNQGAILYELVQTTVAMITEEHGILSRHLGGKSQQRSCPVGTAYEAVLRHHHFDVTKEPQAFVEALEALRQSVQIDPDCAVCWSYLARLGAAHWSLGLPGDIRIPSPRLAAAQDWPRSTFVAVPCWHMCFWSPIKLMSRDMKRAWPLN